MQQNSKIVDQTLTKNEVVGRQKEEPGQSSEPGQAVNTINGVTDGNDFLKTFDLNSQGLEKRHVKSKASHRIRNTDRDHEVQWPHVNQAAEKGDHYDSEQSSDYPIPPAVVNRCFVNLMCQ